MMNIRDLIPWSRSGREAQTRREGADPIQALQSGIDRVFEEFWRSVELPMAGGWGAGAAALPRVDLRETDKAVEITAELPGMDEADVEVELAEGMLTIRAEKTAERAQEEKDYLVRERSLGAVERLVPLPAGLDLDSAQAALRNGVLTITIPKTAEGQGMIRRIPVKRA
jgi:HSP20 family protein